MIALVGGGLAGSLLALLLARRGLSVRLFERRPDLRQHGAAAGRSINLALSARGLRALERTGLKDQILEQAVKMPGREIHPLTGPTHFAPYGKDAAAYYINSISRGGLNQALLQAAETYPAQIQLDFEARCVDVDAENGYLFFENSDGSLRREGPFELMLGSDGADSALRKYLEHKKPEVESYVEWLSHGYKELSIPPGPDNSFLLKKNALHIWPRGQYMLIALPNYDGSFTCTLFLAMQGENNSFEALDSVEKARAFFQAQFPDALALMPHFDEEYGQNPVGKLGTLRSQHWFELPNLALLGDAAHAVVPFYGQGMNASFEDCLALDDCIAQHGCDWQKVLPQYAEMRRDNSRAIADLAIENFYEMRDHVADPAFQFKRQLEVQLENTYADYRSKYSLVTFYPEVSYQQAFVLGNAQDAFLMDFCRQNLGQEVDLAALYQALKNLA